MRCFLGSLPCILRVLQHSLFLHFLKNIIINYLFPMYTNAHCAGTWRLYFYFLFETWSKVYIWNNSTFSTSTNNGARSWIFALIFCLGICCGANKYFLHFLMEGCIWIKENKMRILLRETFHKDTIRLTLLKLWNENKHKKN